MFPKDCAVEPIRKFALKLVKLATIETVYESQKFTFRSREKELGDISAQRLHILWASKQEKKL